jgi:hypothetical protein
MTHTLAASVVINVWYGIEASVRSDVETFCFFHSAQSIYDSLALNLFTPISRVTNSVYADTHHNFLTHKIKDYDDT